MKVFQDYKQDNFPWDQYPCPDRKGADFEDGYKEGLEAGWRAANKEVRGE